MCILFTPSIEVPRHVGRLPGRPSLLRDPGHISLRNRARKLRVEKGKSFRQVAAIMGFSVSTIHAWARMDADGES